MEFEMKGSLKKKAVMAAVLMINGMLFLSACAGEEQIDNRITIHKDGVVEAHMEESFEQSYYDKDELQQMILQEAADYNRQMGSARISVDKVEVKDGKAMAEMSFQKAGDYAAFNKTLFFVGTPAEASLEGYELNIVLSGVKNENETLAKADILAAEQKLLIMSVAEPVYLPGKACYVSENVQVSKDRKSVWLTGEEQEAGYVLYQ